MLRGRLLALLEDDRFPDNLQEVYGSSGAFSLGRTLRPLLALLASGEAVVQARAATALGLLTARLADQDMEAGRNVMRRLMWTLNDESGSIGWGAPQAMAEIMVRHEGLAREYVAILVSYMHPEGNFLEHPPLQRDLLQAIGRLAPTRPRLLQEQGAATLLTPYLAATDDQVRGLAAWCAGFLPVPSAREPLEGLLEDPAEIALHHGGYTSRTSVGALARRALAALGDPPPSHASSTGP